MKLKGPMSRHARRLVFKACKGLAFSSLLDVGCGPGLFLQAAKSRFPSIKIAGIDVSSTAIERARMRLPDAELWEMDITAQSPGKMYDLISMIDVAEHLEDDLAAFRNLQPICRGHLVICTLEGRMRTFEKEIGHVRNYRPGELESKLNESGFELERFIRWGWPVYSPLYRNLSTGIDAHHKSITLTRLALAHVAYFILLMNFPGRGDLIVALARPLG
jgi:2-polyprenyl-3-methyl-5-hydroxy-6-metoxy-1,4-benzoquinol methylase